MYLHDGPLAGHRGDVGATAPGADALPDGRQPEAAGALGIEAVAVVAHIEPDAVVFEEAHHDMARVAVSDRVGGRLSNDAQERVLELKPYLFLWADRISVGLNSKVTTLDGPVNLNTPMYLGNVERWYLKK